MAWMLPQAPTNNINMLKVVGTKDGQIFMAGSDGYLYELSYGRGVRALGWEVPAALLLGLLI